MENPYAAPQVSNMAGDQEFAPYREYGGIRRLAYFGLAFLLGIFQNVVMAGLGQTGAEPPIGLAVLAIFFVFSLIPVYYRLKNIGMNPWWCLGMLVPLLNLLIGIRCLVLPEGYQDTKKLDTAGRVLTLIVAALFIGFVALIVGAMLMSS